MKITTIKTEDLSIKKSKNQKRAVNQNPRIGVNRSEMPMMKEVIAIAIVSRVGLSWVMMTMTVKLIGKRKNYHNIMQWYIDKESKKMRMMKMGNNLCILMLLVNIP